MKKEAFQEIAKHFAETIKVALRFEEGAVPSTNGHEIVLPTEMSEAYLDQTLGALLHETNHIRYTDMKYFQSLDRLTMEVTNAVEDIRVDSKALAKYPNSKCFYMTLVNDVINNRGDKLRGEQLPFKVMKGLILQNFGQDVEKVYGTCDDWDKFCEHMINLTSLIGEIKKCPDTQATHPIVLQIIKELFGNQDKDKQKGKAKDPDEDCNGGQGGNGGTRVNVISGGSSGEGIPAPQDDADPIEQIGDIVDDFEKSMRKDKKEELKSKEKEIESRQHAEAYNKAQRSRKCYNTKIRNLQREAGYNQPLSAEQQKKKARYEEAIKDRTTTMTKENAEWDKAAREQREADNQRNKIAGKIEQLKGTMNDLVGKAFSTSEHSQLLGFNALDKEKLMDKNYVDVPYSIALDELIKEVLIVKQEEYQQEETGRLNLRRLHEIFTDPDNMFIEKEHKNVSTRVNFVVDVSGSMDSYGTCEDESREELCCHALNIIAQSFQKAIKAGAPGEMKVYAFADNVYEAIPSADLFKPIELNVMKSWSIQAGGSTNMSKCVNHIVNEVTSDPEYKNVLVIMTDAEVDDYELSTMRNNISTGDVRVLYIAIGSSLRTPEAQELFGDNNITNRDNAVKILQDVMFQGMFQVS